MFKKLYKVAPVSLAFILANLIVWVKFFFLAFVDKSTGEDYWVSLIFCLIELIGFSLILWELNTKTKS